MGERGDKMVFKWNSRKEKEPEIGTNEYKIPNINENMTKRDDSRESIKNTIDQEIRTMIEEEIKNAAKELAEEQKIVIRVAVEEHKRIIREVLEQEKVAIRAKIEDIRQSLIRYGMG
jgi:hypothetical protein